MNKNINSIVIALLAIVLLVSSATLYLLNTRLTNLEQGIRLAPGKVSADSPEGMCVNSGGEYMNGTCSCGRDYFLENGSCMGQDGLTKKQLEEIKANLELEMRKNQ